MALVYRLASELAANVQLVSLAERAALAELLRRVA